ncbi:putative Ig domain-containing protein [Dactylosporangium sp. CS-047395]|uniref:putative Ig domain-containing protein n=1 Tax=Dactylosporangium sp. CS-047395 TaxID=3239936 RepID=UPI003D89EFED
MHFVAIMLAAAAIVGVPGTPALAAESATLKGYAGNTFGNSVSVIDLATGAVDTTIALGNGRRPQDVVALPDGSKVYAMNYRDADGNSSVSVIDPETDAVATTLPMSTMVTSGAALPDSSRVYLVEPTASKVQVLDTATDTTGPSIPVGTLPVGVALSHDGSRLYVASQVGQSVTVIDTTTNTVTATIPIGAALFGIAVSPTAPRAVVTRTDGTISVIDTAANQVIGSPITVGAAPVRAAYTPDGSMLYVNSQTGHEVIEIEVPSYSVIGSMSTGAGAPFGLSVNPAGDTLYVTFPQQNAMRKIDIGGGTVGAPITLGDSPYGVAVAAVPGLTIAPASLPAAVAGTAYSQPLTASHGSAPFTWAVTAGTLPTGLSLNPATGALTGTATSDGTYHFTVTVTDAASRTAQQAYTFTVSEPAVPDAPTQVTATGQVSSILVSWAAPAGSGVTGYTATAAPSGSTCASTAQTPTSCVLGAEAGKPQTVTVVTHSAAGDSAASAPSDAATATAPVVPTVPPDTSLTLTSDRGSQVSTIGAGERITFLGTGFAPHSTAVVTIWSAPVNLATVLTDANGDFSAPVTIPVGLASGQHRVVAQGVAPDGTARAMALSVSVAGTVPAAGGRLPVTGAGVVPMALTGLALAALGLALALFGRRQSLPVYR